ncbi:MAG: hypothetical protein ABH887_01460 [bacterium]
MRLRRYVNCISQEIVLGRQESYLEIKEKIENAVVGFKKRRKIQSEQAVQVLSKKQKNIFVDFLPANHPPLYPFVGTQVRRTHWQGGGIRITIDPDIFFFGFSGSECRGFRIGSLNETKIEFKYDENVSLLFCQNLEEKILGDMSYLLWDKEYIERKLRLCYAQWNQN